jgi:hypothetical protein
VIGVLDEVDEFCRAGRHLLTLAAPEDIAAYRRWSLGEVALQIDGAPPMSWPQYAEAHGMEASARSRLRGHASSTGNGASHRRRSAGCRC